MPDMTFTYFEFATHAHYIFYWLLIYPSFHANVLSIFSRAGIVDFIFMYHVSFGVGSRFYDIRDDHVNSCRKSIWWAFTAHDIAAWLYQPLFDIYYYFVAATSLLFYLRLTYRHYYHASLRFHQSYFDDDIAWGRDSIVLTSHFTRHISYAGGTSSSRFSYSSCSLCSFSRL